MNVDYEKYERRQLWFDQQEFRSRTLAEILSESEARVAAIHEPDAADKVIASMSVIAACVIVLVVVLFG